jgi:hypothetical protein
MTLGGEFHRIGVNGTRTSRTDGTTSPIPKPVLKT